MKKIIVLTLLAGFIISSNAQISTSNLQNVTKKVSTAVSSTGFNVDSLKTKIMSTLTTKLSLNSDQKTKVLTSVTEFLDSKASIIGLAKTNNNKYVSKLAGLTEKLNSSLKTVLTAQQFSKFLSLKPSTNTSSNVLSQLFY